MTVKRIVMEYALTLIKTRSVTADKKRSDLRQFRECRDGSFNIFGRYMQMCYYTDI